MQTYGAAPRGSAGREPTMLRGFFRRVEDYGTDLAGWLLIASSIVQAADLYSNHALTAWLAALPILWACARAVGVTIWLRPSVQFYRAARRDGRSGFGWLILIGGLALADIQALLLQGAWLAHIPVTGALSWVDPGPVGWLVEVGVLGIVLIITHAVIDDAQYNAAPLSSVAPLTPTIHAQPTTPLYMADPLTPAPMDYRTPPPPPPVVHRTPPPPVPAPADVTGYDTPPSRKSARTPQHVLTLTPFDPDRPPQSNRPNAGREQESVSARIERMKDALRLTPNLTKAQAAVMFGVSESTAYNNLRTARSQLQNERQ